VKRIIVTAAVVERDGRFLVTKRPPGVHLEGCWEFPGGKCNRDETLAACLARELREELGVDRAVVNDEIFTTTHAYEDREVELHFFSCELGSTPVPRLGQEMRWIAREELARLAFPPADDELIRRLLEGSR